jgi:hypothetical protein
MMQAYQAIGLTTAEIDILAKAQKKRDYYYRSVKGRRLFELGLGPAALAFVGASSEKDQHFFDEMLRDKPPAEYARAMLDRRGVAWAAAEMERTKPTVVSEPQPPPPDPLVTDAETIRISLSDLQHLVAETDDSDAVTIPIPRAVPPPLPRPTLRLRKKVAQ